MKWRRPWTSALQIQPTIRGGLLITIIWGGIITGLDTGAGRAIPHVIPWALVMAFRHITGRITVFTAPSTTRIPPMPGMTPGMAGHDMESPRTCSGRMFTGHPVTGISHGPANPIL
jgi:hypothetical protein